MQYIQCECFGAVIIADYYRFVYFCLYSCRRCRLAVQLCEIMIESFFKAIVVIYCMLVCVYFLHLFHFSSLFFCVSVSVVVVVCVNICFQLILCLSCFLRNFPGSLVYLSFGLALLCHLLRRKQNNKQFDSFVQHFLHKRYACSVIDFLITSISAWIVLFCCSIIRRAEKKANEIRITSHSDECETRATMK